MSILTAPEVVRTMADLLERLGVGPARVRMSPPPGTATEQDLLRTRHEDGHLCELVDGVLVEKAMGYRESCLAVAISALLRAFVVPRNLGLVSGADGMLRLNPGLVRVPDVAFVSWSRLPERRMPAAPVPNLAPDLAVEVLSEGNTEEEMTRKRREYFAAGVRLVWLVDPEARSVTVYTAPEQLTQLNEGQMLDGGEVLPGFSVSVGTVFAELDRAAN